AGKTGTGEDYKNAWFCGYASSLSTAVWAGFPTEEVTMSPPTTSITVYGGTWPARIWQEFMAAAHDSAPSTDFVPPPPPTTSSARGKQRRRRRFRTKDSSSRRLRPNHPTTANLQDACGNNLRRQGQG